MDHNYRSYSFEKLDVWKLSMDLKIEIYTVTDSFPKTELYGLTSQLKRSISSITANIVEGSGRATSKDQAYFINISIASALESLDHIITAFKLDFIKEDLYINLRKKLDAILGKLNGLYKYHLKSGKYLKDQIA